MGTIALLLLAWIGASQTTTRVFPTGSTVILAAQPDFGSSFVDFGGDPGCLDGVVSMTTDVHCTATLTCLRAGLGSGEIASLGAYSIESVTDDPQDPAAERAAVTELLQQWRSGSDSAFDELVPMLYQELLRIARSHMRSERSAHTLEPTALVHEAYARMVGIELDWQSRVHFLSVASRTMRRVLVDHARSKQRQKRAGDVVRVTLDDAFAESRDADILKLDDALEALGKLYPRKREVLEMHYFGGMKYDEIAAALEVSEATVARELRFAKAFLGREMSLDSASSGAPPE